MNTVILPESSLSVLKEMDEEVTFFKFFNEIKKFIADLLDDPVHAMPSQFLVAHGLTCKELKNKLIAINAIVRKEDINEPKDENGEPKSTYGVSYKVPRNGFKRKIKRLYQHTFEN
jgi:hypothetical protein